MFKLSLLTLTALSVTSSTTKQRSKARRLMMDAPMARPLKPDELLQLQQQLWQEHNQRYADLEAWQKQFPHSTTEQQQQSIQKQQRILSEQQQTLKSQFAEKIWSAWHKEQLEQQQSKSEQIFEMQKQATQSYSNHAQTQQYPSVPSIFMAEHTFRIDGKTLGQWKTLIQAKHCDEELTGLEEKLATFQNEKYPGQHHSMVQELKEEIAIRRQEIQDPEHQSAAAEKLDGKTESVWTEEIDSTNGDTKLLKLYARIQYQTEWINDWQKEKHHLKTRLLAKIWHKFSSDVKDKINGKFGRRFKVNEQGKLEPRR